MANNTNTDLTEEDAADLQFPKEYSQDSSHLNKQVSMDSVSVNSECLYCNIELIAPYIVCVVCNVNICVYCFANGVEFSNHKNNHDYTIFDDNFVLFENTNWTAKEEITLLNTLLEYGNFSILPRYLPNRNIKDITDHYNYFYLEKAGSALIPTFPEVQINQPHLPVIPYRFRLCDMDEPPRYDSNTFGFHLMAGYNAIRSDFEIEYDSNAEDLISNLDFKYIDFDSSHSETLTNLQCAIINSYNNRLWERQRRKLVIRNHGLILTRKTAGWLHRYDSTITRSVCEKLCKFMQFCTGMQFEFVMEGLHRLGELKIDVSRLCEFLRRGITTQAGAQLYFRLKKLHEESLKDVKIFQNNPGFKWKLKNSFSTTLLPGKKRGIFSPLDVVGLPGYEKLTPKEQNLCRNVRLVPLSYVEFRDILINECRKLGQLKLQTARRLLKIDVNKTRRLYDFLVVEGYINK